MEVLCGAGLDFVVIDAEHAPFAWNDLDVCLLAAKSMGVPAWVRVPDTQASTFLQVLDMGAQGLLIPHAKTVEGVLDDLKKARYFEGGVRGFSNSPRAGGYGKLSMREHTQQADKDVTCIFQIEDAQAVDNIDALAALSDVTGYLIGRADLAMSLGTTDIQSPLVVDAVEKVMAACRKHQKPLGMFVSDAAETARWVDQGMSFFIIGSDQSYLSKYAASVSDAFKKMHNR